MTNLNRLLNFSATGEVKGFSDGVAATSPTLSTLAKLRWTREIYVGHDAIGGGFSQHHFSTLQIWFRALTLAEIQQAEIDSLDTEEDGSHY